MSTSSDLPFSSINPIRCIGINQSYPFCSIVSQGKLIYSSGTNLIMQNTKTNEQKILFNNSYQGDIQLIHHHVTLYNEHLLSIAIRDSVTLMHIIVVIPLNPIIFNEEDKKDKFFTHYLKNIEEFEQIKEIQFFDQGNSFGVVSQYQSLNNFVMIRTSSGQIIYQESFIDTKLSIKAACIKKINCASIMQYNNKGEIRICLIVLDQLSRKYYFNLSLQMDEKVLQYYYESYQQECIMIALTSKGFVLIYKINQYEIHLLNRVDVRKGKKFQQNEGRGHRRQTSILEEKTYYYKPVLIQPASNKIIIAYEDSCIIGMLFYSHYNPANTKFSIIQEALTNFTNVKEIKSIKIAKDNCSLAALLEIYPEKIQYNKDDEEILPSSEHIVNSFSPQFDYESQQNVTEQFIIANPSPIQLTEEDDKYKKEKHYIALQIDILSNMINHEQQAFSTQKTFSVCSGHNTVIKVQYCTYNNTMFLLMKNKMLKYYDLTPKEVKSQLQNGAPLYKDFKIEGLLLWEKLLTAQPHFITVHPFNFTILLVYEQLLKFHYYNIKNLFPAFIITNIKNCSLAKYSPLGDKIILATNGAVIILNSYTFEVMKTVSLPNILSQNQCKRVSLKQKLPVMVNPKLITDFQFLKNGDLLLFSGHNMFTLILNHEKTAHFGFLDLNSRQRFSQMLYDSINNLVILLQEEDILVIAKSNINTKNRCEVISKIEISASSAFLLAQVGVLFIGGKDGVLHILKWPDYCQEELYMRTTNKYYQFRQPIVSINVSTNLNYIYTVSKSGNFCISELQVNAQDDKLSSQVRHLLLSASEIPLRQNNRWLISRTDEDRKQREIIKLRGEEADKINNQAQMIKRQEELQQEMIKFKKAEFQLNYAQQLKDYEDHLGLQKKLQSTTMMKDEIKLFQKKKKRKMQDLNEQKQQKLKEIFEQRTKLEQLFVARQQQNKKQLEIFIQQNKRQLEQLMINLEIQQNSLNKISNQTLQKQKIGQFHTKCDTSNLQENHIEDLYIINVEHKQDYEELSEINQAILSKNRNRNIEIHDFNDKIGDLNIEKQKLEFDMYKIIDQKQRYEELKQKVIAENEYHKKIYDRLIKVSKELEDKVLFQRKEQKNYEYKINKLQEDVQELCEHQNRLSDKRARVNEDFIDEREMNAVKATSISQLNTKLQQLKDLKKVKLYQNCSIKNHYYQIVKTFMRNLEIDEVKAAKQICQMYRSPTFQKKKQSVQSNEFQVLKAHHDKLAQDATKWKEVKQSYMNSFYRNHRKLDQQNLKLTYRYNDLLRLSQEYKVQISNLQCHIEKEQKTHNDWKSLPKVLEVKQTQSRIRPNFSFLRSEKKTNKQNKTHLKKKLICLSFHQDNGKFITQA